jgi:hypothetical protein
MTPSGVDDTITLLRNQGLIDQMIEARTAAFAKLGFSSYHANAGPKAGDAVYGRCRELGYPKSNWLYSCKVLEVSQNGAAFVRWLWGHRSHLDTTGVWPWHEGSIRETGRKYDENNLIVDLCWHANFAASLSMFVLSLSALE